ncbi:hypothetical protein ABKN59_004536 [Abortiporus biennis]
MWSSDDSTLFLQPSNIPPQSSISNMSMPTVPGQTVDALFSSIFDVPDSILCDLEPAPEAASITLLCTRHKIDSAINQGRHLALWGQWEQFGTIATRLIETSLIIDNLQLIAHAFYDEDPAMHQIYFSRTDKQSAKILKDSREKWRPIYIPLMHEELHAMADRVANVQNNQETSEVLTALLSVQDHIFRDLDYMHDECHAVIKDIEELRKTGRWNLCFRTNKMLIDPSLYQEDDSSSFNDDDSINTLWDQVENNGHWSQRSKMDF